MFLVVLLQDIDFFAEQRWLGGQTKWQRKEREEKNKILISFHISRISAFHYLMNYAPVAK